MHTCNLQRQHQPLLLLPAPLRLLLPLLLETQTI
jgi:hypothetical protein